MDTRKNLRPAIDHRVLEPITEESSEDEQLNDSILSFQNFLQDDFEPQDVSDSRYGGNSSDNEDDDVDMESELSDDEPLEKRLQHLMKNAQNVGRKKPGPKPRPSSKRGRSTDIPNVDTYDPRTCGTHFLLGPCLFTDDDPWFSL